MFQWTMGTMGSPRRPQMWWMQNEKCGDENWLAEASCVEAAICEEFFWEKRGLRIFPRKKLASFDALWFHGSVFFCAQQTFSILCQDEKNLNYCGGFFRNWTWAAVWIWALGVARKNIHWIWAESCHQFWGCCSSETCCQAVALLLNTSHSFLSGLVVKKLNSVVKLMGKRLNSIQKRYIMVYIYTYYLLYIIFTVCIYCYIYI